MIRSLLITAMIGLGATVVQTQTPAAAVARGQKVYATERCAVCHSIGNTGNKKGPLDGVGAKLSSAEIREWIVSAPEMAAKTKAGRKPAMKAYPNLSRDDLDALVAYMESLKK